MASRRGCGGEAQRNLRSCRRGERSGGSTGAGFGSSAARARQTPVAMGSGQGRAAAGRAALSARPAIKPASPPDPCLRQQARGCAVRFGGRVALPRSGVRGGRDRGQSARARPHRLAPPQPGGGKARHPAVADPARCAARSRLGTDALGGAFGCFASPALERCRAGHPVVERGAVPCPHPSTRPLDPPR